MRQMDDVLVEEKRKKDMEDAVKKASLNAQKEEKIEIAKSLIEQKVSIDIIKLSTGLTDIELANLTNPRREQG